MLIYFHKAGRLGNRLFAAAHIKANSKANNYKSLILSLEDYSSCLNKHVPHLVERFLFLVFSLLFKLCIKLKFRKSFLHEIIVAEIREFSFGQEVYYNWDDKRFYDLNNPEFLRLAKKKPIVILFGRFFRDYQNYYNLQEFVREQYQPALLIQEKVNLYFQDLKKFHKIIGLHIRRGDYKEFKNGQFYYSDNFYLNLICSLSTNIQGEVCFVICSDEVLDLSSFPSEVQSRIFFHQGDPMEDLYCLSLCDYIVGPPSTFSLWASFYGNKPIYHLKDFCHNILESDFKYPEPEEAYNFIF